MVEKSDLPSTQSSIKQNQERSRRNFSGWFIDSILPTLAIFLAIMALWLWYSETQETSYAQITKSAPKAPRFIYGDVGRLTL